MFCLRYRARIISVNPLEVYFVDFGNTELTEKKDLKILPDEYMKIDPLVCFQLVSKRTLS